MRLIDADALKEVITANHYLLSSRNNSIDYGMFTTGIIQAIDNAPTVIVDSCGKCPYYKDHDRDIITEAYNDGYKTAKEDFESHKLVNNSQELVKDLVKEKSERPQLSDEQIEQITDLLENEWGYEGMREDVERILKGGAE